MSFTPSSRAFPRPQDTPEDLAKEPAGASKGEVSQEQVAEGARTPEADLAETSYGPPPPAEGQSDPPSTLDTLVEEAHVRDAEEAGTGAGEATTQRDIARDMSRAEAAAIIQLGEWAQYDTCWPPHRSLRCLGEAQNVAPTRHPQLREGRWTAGT